MTDLEKIRAKAQEIIEAIDKVSEKGCITGPQVHWFIGGAQFMALAVQEMDEALAFECGGRCNPEYNPCNAWETRERVAKMLEGK